MHILISLALGFLAGAIATWLYYQRALAKLLRIEEWAKRKVDSKL